MKILRVRTRERSQLLEITSMVADAVTEAGLREGAVVLQSLHTTAALTINENADPDVVHDLISKTAQLVPQREPYYRHAEGNSDSHLKTSFFGPSLSVIVDAGELLRKVALQLLQAAD